MPNDASGLRNKKKQLDNFKMSSSFLTLIKQHLLGKCNIFVDILLKVHG